MISNAVRTFSVLVLLDISVSSTGHEIVNHVLSPPVLLFVWFDRLVGNTFRWVLTGSLDHTSCMDTP